MQSLAKTPADTLIQVGSQNTRREPSRGSLSYKGPALQKIIPVLGGI